MPLLRVTHQRGALSDTQKDALAERLTAALLIGEVGADTPAGRAVAYVLFDEVDAARAWYVGGKPDSAPPPGGRLLFDVVYPEGAASQADKSTLHAAINTAVADVLGIDATFPNRAGDWVIVHEPADGAWGAGGQTIGIREINHLAGGEPARADYFESLLAGQKRLREAHGVPAQAWRV